MLGKTFSALLLAVAEPRQAEIVISRPFCLALLLSLNIDSDIKVQTSSRA